MSSRTRILLSLSIAGAAIYLSRFLDITYSTMSSRTAPLGSWLSSQSASPSKMPV